MKNINIIYYLKNKRIQLNIVEKEKKKKEKRKIPINIYYL